MPASDIVSILSTLQESPNNTTEFGANWSQGRSAFGGIAAAFATTAMRKALTTPKPLRSLMVSFVAPLPPGEVSVEATVLREGRNVTQASANVLSGGNICLQALAAFGDSREGLDVPSEAPFAPIAKEKGIPFSEHAKRTPAFLGYFDGFWMNGAVPFAGKLSRQLDMWVRHKVDMKGFEVEKMVTLADIPPPVILSAYEKPPVQCSSLSWSLEFLVPADTLVGDWFYMEFIVEAAANGYTQQSGLIFDESGRLCALTRQCMVYFD